MLSPMRTNSARDCHGEHHIEDLRTDSEAFPSSCNPCLARPNLDWKELTAVASTFEK